MGANTDGQLGLFSSVTNRYIPTELAPSGVDLVATNGRHSLYVNGSGQLYLTGGNDSGQLGNGTGTDVYGFTLLSGYTDVTGAYAGGDYTIFRTGTRTVTDTHINGYHWYGMGNYNSGQLGRGTTGATWTPVALPFPAMINQMALASQHTLFSRSLTGDIDGDVQYTLHDALVAVMILTGQNPRFWYAPLADIDGDGKIGTQEALFILRRVAGM
jgi:alpha-tubulin suppressor-like RCC1 family protein